MANMNVFTGADGSLSLSVPQGTEGDKAKTVLDNYGIISVGRVQNVHVEVHSDVKPFHEIGQRYASELRPGNINISGTIGRAYVNGALIKLLMGEAAECKPIASWAQPSFNITLLLENAANPGTRNALTLHDVKFDGWAYTIPEDDFIMESLSFKALFLTVADEQA